MIDTKKVENTLQRMRAEIHKKLSIAAENKILEQVARLLNIPKSDLCKFRYGRDNWSYEKVIRIYNILFHLDNK